MIISCAPFRVSFAGGGSDMHSFYAKTPGAVLSCAINKYSYIAVHPYFDAEKYNLKYSKTELIRDIEEIEHPILRETLKFMSIKSGIEVASIADIPSGTGLGSSSAFTVALINGLSAFNGKFINKSALAQQACGIEIDKLLEPIGKQDQYASSFGGMNFIEFNCDGSVTVNPLNLDIACLRELESSILLFFTGDQRDARDILEHQTNAISQDLSKFKIVQSMVQLAHEIRKCLLDGDLQRFAMGLHDGWEMKRSLSSSISSSKIDLMYNAARAAGAIGGKLAGAGGAGFLVLFTPISKQSAVRNALRDLQELEFKIDWNGARIAMAQN